MLLGNVCVVRPVGGQPFALIGTDQGNETYIVDDDNDVGEMLVGAPCGCMACDEHAQAGYEHAKCPTPALLAAERAGAIWRAYTDGGWQWFLR